MVRNLTTVHTERRQDALSDILAVNADWRQNRESTIARYKGLVSAKRYAYTETERLLSWGRWLSWPVIFVSAIHIWESVSRIAPEGVTALHLPDWAYHTAAFLFTVLIDIVAVYLLKSNTALAYTSNRNNQSIWFFYILTALLNASFIAGNSPDATAIFKAGIVEVLGNMFIILLPITVPIAIWAIEQSNQKLEASKITLSVDIATLNGLIVSNERANSGNSASIDNKPIVEKLLSTDIAQAIVAPQQNAENNIVDTLPVQETMNKSHQEGAGIVETTIENNSDAYRCMKCDALLPDRGSKRANQGYRMSTKRYGCSTCNPNKTA